MWLSLNWINDFVKYDLDRTPEELGAHISLSVAEVEDVKIIGKALQQVKVVEVVKTEPHPNADKLKLATITDGNEERTIVCGATNCRVGVKVPFADLGAEFEVKGKDGKIEKFVIKATKIRGVESTGMLCSEEELGLADKSDGILELATETQLGVKLIDLPKFSEYQDILFEIDNKSLTHRPDLWGHYGFAREFATIFDLDLAAYPGKELAIGTGNYSVTNDAPESCRRYSAIEIKNVKVSESPEWMKKRLNSVGLNAINNIVDVTNYILLELGQPLHAFDTSKLKDNTIVVRTAGEGEKFKALDDKEYELSQDDLVISNDGVAVALAGVMGGLDSSIDDSTTNILLESANFDAATVRKTSTRLGLRSDSSARFEKSLDPENTALALKRAVQLILELCPSAEVVGDMVDSYDFNYPKLTINTSYDFISKRLGHEISKEFIDNKLSRLGFELSNDLEIKVPSWRATKDISIPEDIVEEVGRIYGFDNIKPEPLKVEISVPKRNKARLLERELKNVLAEGLGFNEVMLYPWLGEKVLKNYNLSSEGLMTLKNAVSEDSKFMKPCAMPLFINSIAENLKYQSSIKCFEFTRIYDTTNMKDIQPTEKFKLVGSIVPEFKKKDLQTDSFYELKQVVLDLLKVSGIKGAQVRPLTGELNSWIHPGISAGIFRGKQCLAEIYKLHPNIAKKVGIKNNVYLFEIHFDQLVSVERKINYKAISKFPSVPFDVTVLADEKKLSSEIEMVINRAAKNYIKSVEVFSIYQGEGVDEGMKAISYRMSFASDKKTLSSEEVANIQNSVIKALEKAGYPLK